MAPEEIAKRIDEWWFGPDDPEAPVEGDVPGESLRETITLALHAYRAQVIEEVALSFDASAAAYEGNGKADRASLDLYFNLARQERAAAETVRALAAK